MGRPTDQEIVAMLRKDKSGGIRLLFLRYYESLVGYAISFLKDAGRAEDVVQDFFVRLWEDDYLKEIPERGLIAYLYTAVRNACLTALSKKDVLLQPEALPDLEVPVEVFRSIDDERIGLVMREVELLPARSREAVQYVMLQGMKYKEAAAAMQISVNTVKFLLKEATRRLRNRLENYILPLFYIFSEKV